ncbi:DUF4389 domain-containing protein [Arthrobacter sp. MSA 4-2]|uniref:DUF4389 domain-containing protein n=1 Tax=Arthrobacter sp. MSA 4-2 TaxID=2794349 RepID=UPI0018E85D52|nr:DUF4389 domain-containing protein [Arthrobacter sp. MSA 4-2]MBJ2119853.1 DUF4389 domain-containing protein [Arthrobacter sp. MSA 4-2]
MKTRSIILLVAGILLAMTGLGLLAGGIGSSLVSAAQNDGGYLSSPQERFSVDSRAITAGEVEELRNEDLPGSLPFDVGSIRVLAQSANPGHEIFVGIAPREEVERYLAGSNYSQVLEVENRPFRVEYREVEGAAQPEPPAEQDFWVAAGSGPGQQEIDWNIQPGSWTVVVMNADASAGVAADLQAGFRSELFGPLAGGLLIAGSVLLLVGIPLLILGAMGLGRDAAPPVAPGGVAGPAGTSAAPGSAGQGATGQGATGQGATGQGATGQGATGQGAALPGPGPARAAVDRAAVAGAAPARPVEAPDVVAGSRYYPARLVGQLDPVLSRWKWLIKWFLAIPHFILLFFLWFAFGIITIVAGFSILFTGRYPRPLFYFNVGVVRWNWRVAFYAYAAAGTDRYPPFTLAKTDYPADYDVEYPARLSRGLVLVKWWLLAIPHLLIVAAFTGSNTTRWIETEDLGVTYETGAGPSLLGLLVLVAVLILLFTGRYHRPLFEFILGINRWTYRTITYTALMRDEYPPFRLDQGGQDPAALYDGAGESSHRPPPR